MILFPIQTACAALATERKLWILDHVLTVAIAVTVLAAVAFIAYVVFQKHKK